MVMVPYGEEKGAVRVKTILNVGKTSFPQKDETTWEFCGSEVRRVVPLQGAEKTMRSRGHMWSY